MTFYDAINVGALMVFYWLGIFFLSALGMFLFPVYGVDNSAIWLAFLGMGILCNIIGYSRTELTDTPVSRQKLWLFLVPLITGIIAFRFPFNLPFYVVGAGVVMSFFSRTKLNTYLCSGIILSGMILGLQTACVVPYFKLAARYHAADFFTPFFFWVLKGLGITCSSSQGMLFFQTPREVLSLVTMWEKLGLFFSLSFFAGALVLICFSSNSGRRLVKFKNTGILFISLIVYSVIRYVFLSVIYIDIGKAEVFWEPIIVTGSYLPLPFLLPLLIRVSKCIKNPLPTLSFSRKSLYAGILSFSFFFAMVAYGWFPDPGSIKKGRILFDEYYSNWEWTDQKLDTKWFGTQSVYNYYCFADYLKHFYSVEVLRKAITDEFLAKYDVFIVKTPTSSFSKREIESIETFVKNGGGLFLIGDHTNVFGTTMNINPLAEKFGIRFNYDSTYDLRTSDLHLHEHNTLFRHPAVQRMPYFLFATSCSISAPLTAEDIITASNLKTMHLDYSRGGFFPDKAKEKNYPFGLFLQSVGVKHGKGRVLAFSDSTCFSNFYMYIPGKPEYVQGVINWLNRMNYYDRPVKAVSVFVMIISLILMLYLGFRGKKDDSAHSTKLGGLMLCGGVLGLSTGALVFSFLMQTTYALPSEHTQMKKVGFENHYSNFRIPDKHLLHNPSIDFHTFYVWTQRLGYVPTLFSLEDSLDGFDLTVFINPEGNFSEAKLKEIEDYVTKGGRLLIIDNPKGRKSTARQILDMFGVKVLYDQYQEKVEVYDGPQRVGMIKSFAPIEGGKPLLFSKDKKPLISLVEKGEGMVFVMAGSTSFTNKEMGKTENIPNEDQLFLYKMEFWMLTGLMEKHFESFTSFNF
jgi:hypothetical protein